MSKLYFLPVLTVLFFLIRLTPVDAQVPVEISSQKIIVEGKVYYMHTVRKGQTVYSISRAYGITEEILKKENPSSAGGIKEGQVLKVPSAQTQSQTPQPQQTQVQTIPQNASKSKGFIYHIMAKDETAYSLSKKYNVTVEDIVRSNPGLNINSIPVGTSLAIPEVTAYDQTEATLSARKEETQAQIPSQSRQQETQPAGEGKNNYHRVTKGETLSSISREYNISLRDLKKANKGLLFPKEGEYILIPSKESTSDTEPIEQTLKPFQDNQQENPVEAVEESAVRENHSETTNLKDLKGSVKVAVLLPFFLAENASREFTDSSTTDAKGQTIYKEGYQPGEWIYETSIPFVEMYEGVLLAADSLRSLGLDVELDVYDTGDDTIAIERLISTGKLREADLILGPVYSAGLENVAKYASVFNIPVVSPVPLRDPNILLDNTSLFKMCPSPVIEQEKIAKEVAAIPDANIVFMYSDSLMYNPITVSYKRKLTEALTNGTDTVSVKFRDFFFSGRMIKKTNVYKDANGLESQMVAGKENVVILAISDSPKVSGVLSLLHTLSRKFNIRVVGTPEILDLWNTGTIDLRYFYDLRMMIPVDSYVDYSRPEVCSFLRNFNAKFKTEPKQENFAWRGFDMGFYFIGGVALYGDSFIRKHDRYNPLLLSSGLNFIHKNPHEGFENHDMFILQYNKDMTITVLPAKE